ncbi:hypothetical protein [Pseudomonas sp. A34-9]|uniref:hypothetical protein n=1 Tax=Pseudomonas sp. A34-9 TaxID=3034675 RepID=UPI00240DB095|nr:hypothetical protein [Pseudomonas sp. A34-9]
MKILIADKDIKRGESIEHQFNKLGYFSVLTLSNYRDLRTLTYYCPQRLGMVVVSEELLEEMAIEPTRFFEENALIRHLLVFNPKKDHLWSKTFFNPHPTRWMRLVSKFDFEQLTDFLMLVDPVSEEVIQSDSLFK